MLVRPAARFLTGNLTVRLLHELKRRRLAQYVTAYGAGGWAVLEVLDQLIQNAIVPGFLYNVALVLFLCCIPGVFIITWYHGAKGDQVAPTIEKVLLAGVCVVALAAGGVTVRRGLAENAPTVAALDALKPTDDPRRIAVLYFEAPQDAEFLASGLTESLITELSQVQPLTVVSRNGVVPYRDSRVTADSVGRALQVGTVVEGRLAQSDSVVRISVEMTKVSDGSTIKSFNVQRPRTELFELQDELARTVALNLREAVGTELQLIEGQSGTDNVQAWELLQRAQAARDEAAELTALDDVEAARRSYEGADSLLAQAEKLDPDWVTPTTQRGWIAYDQARLGGFDRPRTAEWIRQGMEHANRALGKNSTDADALELRGTLQYWPYLINLTEEPGEAQRLFEGAERDFQASVRNNPQQASAHAALSHLLLNKGSTSLAKVEAERSYRADPYLRNANVTLWRLFFASLELQDETEARNWCNEGRRRFEDDFRFRECQVWMNVLPRGAEDPAPDIARGWELCDEWVDLAPPNVREFHRARCQIVMAMSLVRAGLPDSARHVLERSRVAPDVDPIRDLSYLEAIARTWLGDYDVALERLSEFLAANPAQAASFADDDGWWLADLRKQPGWATLVGGP